MRSKEECERDMIEEQKVMADDPLLNKFALWEREQMLKELANARKSNRAARRRAVHRRRK